MARPQAATSEIARPLAGQRILVVEDEIIIAMDVQASLEDGGAEVIGPAHTLSEALSLASGCSASAAVLDLRLGRDDALPVARVLAARGIPFLFYTGQGIGDPLCAEWPQTPLVPKPATSLQLVGAVAELLAETAG